MHHLHTTKLVELQHEASVMIELLRLVDPSYYHANAVNQHSSHVKQDTSVNIDIVNNNNNSSDRNTPLDASGVDNVIFTHINNDTGYNTIGSFIYRNKYKTSPSVSDDVEMLDDHEHQIKTEDNDLAREIVRR